MNNRLLLTISMAVCVLSCTKEATQTSAVVSDKEQVKNLSALVPGQMIVQFDSKMVEVVEKQLMAGKLTETGNETLDRALAAIGATGIERLYEDGGEWEWRHREAGLHQWYRIHYNEEVTIQTKAGTALLDAVPGIIYREPVRKVKTMGTTIFNDPRLSQQWHYYNDGSKNNWIAGNDINVVPVWEQYTGGSSEVIVSIVDGGIQMDHEDLAAVVIPAGANGSRNFFNNSYSITAHSHGTHVAGTVGAINNNGKGVCGVAGGLDGNGGVKLMSCQVFDESQDYGNGFYNAMVWGADHGAVISQNSWGNVYQTAEEAKNGGVGGMKGAIDYFIKYAGIDKNGNQVGPMKGGVVIFAAGNDGWPDGWPAEYDGDGKCIAVGSFSSRGTRAYYSNYGDWVDIAAPGGDAYIGPQVLSTVPFNSYGSAQGTSMACPHASGVAALIISHFGGPGFTNDMLVERLLGGANSEAFPESYKIGPRIDAYGSFKYGGTIAPEGVSDYTVEGTGGNIDFTWTVTADEDDEKAFGYILFASKNKSDFTNLKYSAIPSTMMKCAFTTGDLAVGDEMKGNISGLEFGQKYYTAIVAYDYGKSYSELSTIKEATTTENQAPKIEPQVQGAIKCRSNQDLNVLIKIYDPDHHTFNVSFKTDCEYAKDIDNKDGTHTLQIQGTKANAGTFSATYIAKDSYGKINQKNIDFEILPNHAPVVKKPIENLLLERVGQTIVLNIDDYIYDEDGDSFTFETTHSNPKILHVSPSANELALTSLGFGMDEITIHALDIKKAEGVFTFKVKVRSPDSEADVYPTQITDFLNIGGGKEAETYIRIYSSTGKLVYEATVTSSAFNPAKIDLSGLAPGIYTVKVTIDGKETVRTVVKL